MYTCITQHSTHCVSYMYTCITQHSTHCVSYMYTCIIPHLTHWVSEQRLNFLPVFSVSSHGDWRNLVDVAAQSLTILQLPQYLHMQGSHSKQQPNKMSLWSHVVGTVNSVLLKCTWGQTNCGGWSTPQEESRLTSIPMSNISASVASCNLTSKSSTSWRYRVNTWGEEYTCWLSSFVFTWAGKLEWRV